MSDPKEEVEVTEVLDEAERELGKRLADRVEEPDLVEFAGALAYHLGGGEDAVRAARNLARALRSELRSFRATIDTAAFDAVKQVLQDREPTPVRVDAPVAPPQEDVEHNGNGNGNGNGKRTVPVRVLKNGWLQVPKTGLVYPSPEAARAAAAEFEAEQPEIAEKIRAAAEALEQRLATKPASHAVRSQSTHQERRRRTELRAAGLCVKCEQECSGTDARGPHAGKCLSCKREDRAAHAEAVREGRNARRIAGP